MTAKFVWMIAGSVVLLLLGFFGMWRVWREDPDEEREQQRRRD